MFGWGGNGDDGKWEMKNGDENVIFPLFGWNKKEDERKGHDFFFLQITKKRGKKMVLRRRVKINSTFPSLYFSIIANLITRASSIL